jgi:Domain of unknown function (DUF4378)/DUF761-associated sequence motif
MRQMGVQLAPAFDILPTEIKRHSRKLSLLGDEEERRLSDTPETPRTPSLVARLMGIDGLPDPAPSPPATARQKQLSESTKNQLKKREQRTSKLHECKKEPRQPLRNINCNARLSDVGCRSLPDTPRVSSAYSWDIDARHSLQIHRENSNSNTNSSHSNVPFGEYSLPPSPTHYPMKPRRKYQNENKSPRSREYAKEIVKQMKESITNRKENSSEDGNSKSKRSSARGDEKHDRSCHTKPTLTGVSPRPQSVPAPSSKTTELPMKAKLQDHIPNLNVLERPVRVKPSRPPPSPPAVAAGGPGKCNKGTNERFTARFKKPTPPMSGFLSSGTGIVTGDETCSVVIEKNEITPKLFRSPQVINLSIFDSKLLSFFLSSFKVIRTQLIYINAFSNPRFLHYFFNLQLINSIKKDESTSSLQPKILKSCRTRPDQDLEYKYVRSMLHRGGFMGPSHNTKRYSRSSPVDPIVFHQLEVELPVDDTRYRSSALQYRWNRKHIFHLVQELLSDLLDCTGHSIHLIYNGKCNAGKNCYNSCSGAQLLRKLWKQIERIPSADCQYLGDIDELVAADIPVSNIRELTRHPAMLDLASDVAAEVEQVILDELIEETAASLSLSPVCL